MKIDEVKKPRKSKFLNFAVAFFSLAVVLFVLQGFYFRHHIQEKLHSYSTDIISCGLLSQKFKNSYNVDSYGAIKDYAVAGLVATNRMSIRRIFEWWIEVLDSKLFLSECEKFEIIANLSCFKNRGEEVIHGINNASKIIFKVDQSEINYEQAIYLNVMLQKPSMTFNSKFKDDTILRRNKLIQDLLEANKITDTEAMNLKAQPISAYLNPEH